MSDFVTPQIDRLHLSGGEWIDVKHELNAGEQRRLFSRMIKDMRAGEKAQLDPEEAGRAAILAYVVNWSFTNNGEPVKFSADALDNLNTARFAELNRVLTAHQDAVEAKRVAEKNGQDGESKSSPTSPLPGVAAGATSGLLN